jgi:hypothetical protein
MSMHELYHSDLTQRPEASGGSGGEQDLVDLWRLTAEYRTSSTARTAKRAAKLKAMTVRQQQQFAAFFGIKSLRVKGKPWTQWALAVDAETCDEYLLDMFDTCGFGGINHPSESRTRTSNRTPKPKSPHHPKAEVPYRRPARVSRPSAKMVSMVAEGAEKRQLKQTVRATALGPEEYEVECLQAKRSKGGKCQYLVKWVGWKEATWEPSEHVNDQCIAEFTAERAQPAHKKQRRYL